MMDGNASDYEPAESETPPCPIGAYYRARVQERPASYRGDEHAIALAVHKRLLGMLPVRTISDDPQAAILKSNGGGRAHYKSEEMRERVMALVGLGLTRQEMADRAGCSLETLRYHLGASIKLERK